MLIGIADADLIGRKKHRFPNLACMKISGYHKAAGDTVCLLESYDGLSGYDRVYVSKVFTDTAVPDEVLASPNVQYGGTGFFYDKAKPLPDGVEHHMPDYHLYDEWVEKQMQAGAPRVQFKYYLDYSIGFLTRGCFRHCSFCVNQNYDRALCHSPLTELVDASRKKICLLDDNFFACADWKRMLRELKQTGKPFQFKQGLDERLLTPERCGELFSCTYDGDYIFAFDNLADAPVIEKKIELARKYSSAVFKFYCFTGYDRADRWDMDFWVTDIFALFERIRILQKWRCIPYVMRFARYTESPYRGMYVSIARWCNQPSFFKKKSFREFALANGENSACFRYAADFEKLHPEASFYYDLRFGGDYE